MPLSAKRCISGLKSSVSLRHLLGRVLPLDLVRPVVPFRGQCGVRGAQPFVPWYHVVLTPSSRGLVCVAAVPGCAAFLFLVFNCI